MINFFEDFTKKTAMIIIAVVLSLLLLQFLVMKEIKSVNDETQALKFETETLNNMLKRRSEAVSRYKFALRFNQALLPSPVETPTQFYAAIINILSSTELRGAEVTKTSETSDSVSFSVKGEAAYFSLLEVLAAFRQSSYMMRLTEITVEGRSEGTVNYSFVVQAKINEHASENQTGGGDKR